MNINTEDKIKLIEGRMQAIAREHYNQELNLKIYESYGETEQVINATKSNLDKQQKAYNALQEELTLVKG